MEQALAYEVVDWNNNTSLCGCCYHYEEQLFFYLKVAGKHSTYKEQGVDSFWPYLALI